MKELKVGVIGCGAIGKAHVQRLSNEVAGAKVTAVSDYVQDTAREVAEEYDAQFFASAKDLIAYDEVDAILIASSDPSHAEYTLECIRNRKPVLCEKPLALTASDCEKILHEEMMAESHLVQVGFMRRYDSGYVEMKKAIENGRLGTPLMINCAHRNFYQPENFKTDMAITNVAIHELDISRWLLSDEYEDAQVLKVRQNTKTNSDHLNPQLCILQTKAGARVIIEVQTTNAYAYDIQCQVVGELGVINLPDPSRAYMRTEAHTETPLMTDWSERFIDAYTVELQEWVKGVHKNCVEGPSAWDGYAACVTADALITSRKTGKPEKVLTIEKPEFYK